MAELAPYADDRVGVQVRNEVVDATQELVAGLAGHLGLKTHVIRRHLVFIDMTSCRGLLLDW